MKPAGAVSHVVDPVSFLHDLVAIPSLPGQELEVARLMVQTMQSCGLEATIDQAGNALGIRDHSGGAGTTSRDLVLLGHMDTVPGEIPVRIDNGILYGRGAVDAKGPLAAFVMAAARAKIPPGSRVIIIGAVEEESVTSKGARHAAKHYQPALCIIGEPSGWDGVTIGYKGRLLLQLQLNRSTGHSAGQHSGVAEAAIGWWNQLTRFVEDFNSDRGKLFDQLIPSIGSFHTTTDGMTDTAQLRVVIRLPPEFDCGPLIGTAAEWCSDATLDAYGYEAAYQTTRTTPLARQFNVALRQMGAQPRFKLKTGTCDMNVVGPIWQCPIVAYGPGDSSLDHTPDEHVVLDEYLRSIEVLTCVLERC